MNKEDTITKEDVYSIVVVVISLGIFLLIKHFNVEFGMVKI